MLLSTLRSTAALAVLLSLITPTISAYAIPRSAQAIEDKSTSAQYIPSPDQEFLSHVNAENNTQEHNDSTFCIDESNWSHPSCSSIDPLSVFRHDPQRFVQWCNQVGAARGDSSCEAYFNDPRELVEAAFGGIMG